MPVRADYPLRFPCWGFAIVLSVTFPPQITLVREKRRKTEDITSNASNVIIAGSSEEVCIIEEEGFLDVF
ncbi:hypothetical protein ACFX1T_030290 [Malus domestica]